MNFIRDGVVPPFRHVAAHVLSRCHANDFVAVGLPESAILRGSAFLVFYDFVQALLLEVEGAQSHPVSLHGTTGVRVGERPEVSSRTALAVTVLPEIRELGFLSADAEDPCARTKIAPAFAS